MTLALGLMILLQCDKSQAESWLNYCMAVTLIDLPGLSERLISSKLAPNPRGAHEEKSFQRLREADRTSVAEAAKKHKVSEPAICA